MRKALAHLKASDPRLGAVIERVGRCQIQYIDPTFPSLVRSIVYQQLSGKAAATIYGRLLAAAGDPLTPEGILSLTEAQMRAIGLSRQKTAYVRDLAERTQTSQLSFEHLGKLDDQQVIEMLTQVKGVGVWTVHMFLIFALRRPDILPTGDLGIRNAVQKLYGLRRPPLPADIEKIAGRWRPYCSVASWYLWRSLELND